MPKHKIITTTTVVVMNLFQNRMLIVYLSFGKKQLCCTCCLYLSLTFFLVIPMINAVILPDQPIYLEVVHCISSPKLWHHIPESIDI